MRMSEYAMEQEQQHNESGMDLCEAWHEQMLEQADDARKASKEEPEDEQIEVCIYCGNERPSASYVSCCGEVHFEWVNKGEE